MKRSLLFCAVLCIAMPLQAVAQWLDSTDATYERNTEARHIFDVPGSTNLDPDETLEYLDALNSMTGDTLERLHADPEISWQEARRALLHHRATSLLRSDSGTDFALRSRGSSALDPYAQAGYISGTYLGGPEALYNRIIARSSSIEVEALEQKQAWEQSFTDHLTGFAELRNTVPIAGTISIEKAVAGTYALAFGNGLMFGGGLASSGSLHGANSIEERSFGLSGSVTNSSHDLLGGVVEFVAGPANFIFFASDRSFDATVKNDTIRTISTSSVHSTTAQIELEDAASAQVIGARAELKTNDTARLYLKGGVTAYDLRYSAPYIGTTNDPFLGRELEMAGADLLTMSGAWTGIAETAISSNDTSRKTAFLLSTIFEPADRVAFSLLYRYVPDRFLSPFGEISGQSASTVYDFEGYYFGIELAPIPDKLRLNVYANIDNEIVPLGDLFGKERHDYLLSANYRPSRSLELAGTVRDQENANVISDTSSTGYVTLEGQTLNERIDLTYTGTNGSFRTRYEHVSYGLTSVLGSSSEDGWQASEEVRIAVPKIRSAFTVSATRFQTASARSSVWSYEPASPGIAILEQLYGLGWRIGVRDVTKLSERFAVSAYFSGTTYDVPHTIGSGLTAHTGTSDYSATLQLDIRI